MALLHKTYTAALQDKSLGDLTVMLLVVWTLAVMLMAGSQVMYRVLEGYSGPVVIFQTLLRDQINEKERQAAEGLRLEAAAIDAEKALDEEMEGTDAYATKERVLDETAYEYEQVMRRYRIEYPADSMHILPTRFGNVLRAFEAYPRTVYGVESIHLWPRLLAVVPSDYQNVISDARAPVDFFVSMVFILFALGVVAIVRFLFAAFGVTGALPWAVYAAASVLCFGGSWASYLWATASAEY